MANCFDINPLVHRAGQIKGFTGIDQPYERPDNPEVVVDTVKMFLLVLFNFDGYCFTGRAQRA